MEKYLDPLRSIMADTSSAILEIYQQDFSVFEKDDKSPLTEADLVANKIITAGLKEISDLSILSEEGKDISWDERKNWQQYWLVDPIDGTKEFIKKNGEFTVNIALIDNGVPVLGVVTVPARAVSYIGIQGKGAWKENANGMCTDLAVNPSPISGWKVIGSRSHNSESALALAKLLPESEFVSMGSSLKLCSVAEGKADIYPRFGPTSEWDTAAAQAVVEAAGGMVINLDLTPLRYNTKESLLNPYFVVCSEINELWSGFVKNLQ